MCRINFQPKLPLASLQLTQIDKQPGNPKLTPVPHMHDVADSVDVSANCLTLSSSQLTVSICMPTHAQEQRFEVLFDYTDRLQKDFSINTIRDRVYAATGTVCTPAAFAPPASVPATLITGRAGTSCHSFCRSHLWHQRDSIPKMTGLVTLSNCWFTKSLSPV